MRTELSKDPLPGSRRPSLLEKFTTSESSIETQLEQLHAARVEAPELNDASEAAALLAWAERYADPHGRTHASAWTHFMDALGGRRLAVAFALVFVVVFGACVMPTSYEIPLGLRIDVRGEPGEHLPVRELTQFVHGRSGAAKIEVMAREVVLDGGVPTAELSIVLWDQSAALGELEGQLREQFPVLANAEIHEQALAGELDTIWGRRLVHRAFRMPPRDVDVEHARAALLLELHSRGFQDDEVVVEVRDLADGHREVEIHIEREFEGDEPPMIEDPDFHWVMQPEPQG